VTPELGPALQTTARASKEDAVTTITAPDRHGGAPGSPFDKRQWRRAMIVLHLTIAVLIAVYVLQGTGRSGSPVDTTRTAPQEPLAVTTDTGADTGADPVAVPAVQEPAPTPAPLRSPRVADVVRASFTTGDPWPVGAASRDTAAVSWPLGIVHSVFVHGPAEGPNAVSWLARALPTDVRAVGATVRFASEDSGAVALTAWRTSVLAESGQDLPRTGMRLVAWPGRWRLLAIDGDGTATLTAGRYAPAGRTASFGLVRRGSHVWVTDPSGEVTEVSDPRVAAQAGPWASWELRDQPGTASAAIEEIWAG
jgi:hypothetical protein